MRTWVVVVLVFLALIFFMMFSRTYALYGGSTVDWAKDYPYVVQVFPDAETVCTGTAVDDYIVLTAAHCVKEGMTVQSSVDSYFLPRAVTEIKAHPDYKIYKGRAPDVRYDIALVKVEGDPLPAHVPFQFTKPVVMDTSETALVGFGRTDETLSDLNPIRSLKVGRASVYNRGLGVLSVQAKVGNTICDDLSANTSWFESRHKTCEKCTKLPMCKCSPSGWCVPDGSPEQAAAVLQGDSGGGVFLLGNDGKVSGVVGVNSAGTEDANRRSNGVLNFDYLGLFTDLSTNKDWIKQEMENLGATSNETDWDAQARLEDLISRPYPIFFGVYWIIIFLFAYLLIFHLYNRRRSNPPPAPHKPDDEERA